MTKILIDEAVANQPQAVPLHEQLALVPANARLVVESEDGTGTLFIPVGRLCQEAAAAIRQALADAALDKMAENASELGLSYEQPAQQEPVGEAQQMSELVEGFTHCIWDARAVPIGTKLYTTPQAQPAPEIAIADAYRAGVDSGIAAEREACAKVVEDFARKWWKIHCDSNKHLETTLKAHQDFCALQAAIRARGNT